MATHWTTNSKQKAKKMICVDLWGLRFGKCRFVVCGDGLGEACISREVGARSKGLHEKWARTSVSVCVCVCSGAFVRSLST